MKPIVLAEAAVDAALAKLRVLAGPARQQGYRSIGDRYSAWRQDVGQGLNRIGEQFGSPVQDYLYEQGYARGTTPEQIISTGLKSGARWLGENTLNSFGRDGRWSS